MELSEAEKKEIEAHLARNEPLPEKFRWKLFADPRETELIWPGKTQEVTTAVLPFQVIEQVDEPRHEAEAGTPDLFTADAASGRQSGGWTNKLIWGDNKLVLSSLKNGPLRREIEKAGGLKLVYIDPPFDVGADFSINIEVGGGEVFTKEPSVLEDVAYRDTWGKGADSFVAMISERLLLIQSLLADEGTILVHCDHRVNSHIRLLLDEIFGSTNLKNEVIWQRISSKSNARRKFGTIHDTILIYDRNSERAIWNQPYRELRDEYVDQMYRHIEEGTGRRFRVNDLTASMSRASSGQIYEWRGKRPPPSRCWVYAKEKMEELASQGRVYFSSSGYPGLKHYLDESQGERVPDVWTDVSNASTNEQLYYPTQKPEALLERIISASSNPGDLVADFFCGSGTTLAVAEKLGRKWIGCDLGRFAIHTSRKRLIGVQRELKKTHKPYRAFEILNLGKYERQYFVGIDPTLPEAQRRALSLQKEEHFVGLILSAYKGERVFQSPPFHGRKGRSLVLVGPVDAPVTQSLVREAVKAAAKLGVTDIDILGFEFEMGLIPRALEEARNRGIRAVARYIPKDVFDKRAVDKGQVTFHDVAYLDVKAKAKARAVTVTLADFAVSYRQEDADHLAGEMKAGGTKVTVDNGQVVKLAKDKKGIITREVLTKHWTDWIDYWSVDFDYHSKQEIVTVTAPDGGGRMVDRPQWTGGYVFENEWQSFRTRRDRTLELTSAPHEYAAKGRYAIAVKVIDIFGNDTTKVVEVTV